MHKYYMNKRKKGGKLFYSFLYLLLGLFLLTRYFKYDYKKVFSMAYFNEIKMILLAGAIVISVAVIIKAVSKILTRNKYIAKRYSEVDKMNGEEFELFLKAHFEKQGYSVKTTPKTNDYGVDLVCSKGNSKMVIQAKRYNGKVGIGAVQQIVGGMKYYSCNIGVVATNSYFTSNAWELAKRSNVLLWDRNKLTELLNIEK